MGLRRAAGAVALCLGLAGPAAAHSLLLESSPAAGASVAAPRRLALRFNNRVEKALSRLRVFDARGARVAVIVPATGGAADRLEGALPPLAPGTYRVQWQVLSTDGHIVSGTFSFTVAP